MLRIIISDDEPDVCQLIKCLIDWEGLSLELAAIAYNGIKCYEAIVKMKPDIVITDIRMPGLSGLELIQKTLEQDIRPTFIIISGYQHFEYAQQAMRYHVSDYLLKPINKKELNDCLRKIVQEINTAKESASARHEQTAVIRKIQKSLQNHLIYSIIQNPQQFFNITLEELNEVYNTSFDLKEYMCLCLDLASTESGVSRDCQDDFASVLFYLEKLIIRMAEKKNIKQVTTIYDNQVICIMNCSAQENYKVKCELSYIYQAARDYLQRTESFRLCAALSRHYNAIMDFPEMVREARRGIYLHLRKGTASVIDLSVTHMIEIAMSDLCPIQQEGRITNAISALDTQNLIKIVDAVFESFKQIREGNPAVLYEFCSYLEKLITQTFDGSRVNLDIQPGVLIPDGVQSIAELCSGIKTRITSLFEKLSAQSQASDISPVRTAKLYVQAHYMESIRLSDVAEIVHMNASYFSSVFKKETGITFSDYILQQRLEKAKELLRMQEYTISEIANKVGYSEVPYFSKLFTKHVGITPSQYRTLHA